MTTAYVHGPLERDTRSIGGPVVVGHPADRAIRCHGWGNYTFSRFGFSTARRFYAAHGEDALGLACQHWGCEPGDLRYHGFGW